MVRSTRSRFGRSAAVVGLTAVLATQVAVRLQWERPARSAPPPAAHAVWAFSAASLGAARNLVTEIVLGRVVGVTPGPDLVVSVPGEPNGEDRTGVDLVTIAVERVYQGDVPLVPSTPVLSVADPDAAPGRTLRILQTRGLPPEPAEPSVEELGLERLVDVDDEALADVPGPSGALSDDPPYAVGERYVLFLLDGRPVADLPTKIVLAPEGRYLVTSAETLRPVSDRGFAPSMAGKALSKFELELATLDTDGDGVPDTTDNCPAWKNSTQARPPWPVPRHDPDCDGFSNRVDHFTGKRPLVACADSANPGAWPPDLDNNRMVEEADIDILQRALGSVVVTDGATAPSTDLRYESRFDLNADFRIDAADEAVLRGFHGKSCAAR